MLEKKLWFMRSAQPGSNVEVATDEPSHIHIARPSRLLRRGRSRSPVEPTGEARDPGAAEVAVQAA
jgi:hypothetical protein